MPAPRFNEAGAIEPRKREDRVSYSRCPASFNEAGAIEPRKHSWHSWRPASTVALQ